MDQELRELYQEMIIEHSRNPRNFRIIENPSEVSEGYNPLCGDKITVFLTVSTENIISDISFQGCGCAISQASGSLMTELMIGEKTADALVLFELFHDFMVSPLEQENKKELPTKLNVFSSVQAFPMRVKCATLAWHTMKNALEGKTT